MSRSSLAFHWQGVDWQLLADKALWHPGEKTLFIATVQMLQQTEKHGLLCDAQCSRLLAAW